MELFVTSFFPTTSPPTTGLPKLDTNGAVLSDHHREKGVDRHDNFIRLLQHASLCQTPIVPLTWEPAFDKLGKDGFTGTVDQNFLNSKDSLAFK